MDTGNLPYAQEACQRGTHYPVIKQEGSHFGRAKAAHKYEEATRRLCPQQRCTQACRRLALWPCMLEQCWATELARAKTSNTLALARKQKSKGYKCSPCCNSGLQMHLAFYVYIWCKVEWKCFTPVHVGYTTA